MDGAQRYPSPHPAVIHMQATPIGPAENRRPVRTVS